MKKIAFILMSLLLVACGDFDEINTNPDSTTSVTPEFLATNLILNITASSSNKAFLHDSWLMKSTGYTELMENYVYNKFDRADFGSYSQLISADKMLKLVEEDKTRTEGEANAFRGFNLFVQALTFYNETMALGDVPCSESLKGESEGLFMPKYDTQEDVFYTILKDLEQSADYFNKATTFKGDFVYNGDPNKWMRTVNSFTLRVLSMLSKKDKVKDIVVKNMFETVAQQPLIENEGTSLQRTYSDKSSQRYPFYYEQNMFWVYPVMSSFLVNMMKDLNDYRLFYYAEPAVVLASNGESSFDAYSGVDPVMENGRAQVECSEGKHSLINRRYHRVASCEPIKEIAYSEMQFVLAEAALNGWKTPLTAKEHYEKGVKAAMTFTAKYTPQAYTHGVAIDDAYIDAYLKGKAAFNANESKEVLMEKIFNQKYIASFLQLAWNSYFDYRRTGFPKIPINPETNMNEVKTKMPVRWMYPESEYSVNRTNIEEAIKRQYNGSDTPNDVMWLLK
ncbi:SusD/RagB family nutrient-binding outer membrane lipoprotein [uncultured Bacteroides sp.]|uniref:SusD/RagB family nutrient-binding outer membrane lipoprotein n=1 Tax=uncultured Bacteroides sp. TaxID=162156 RepID=UPI002AAB3ED2|nr:SusD/RagB family nutrient-binding outer membrane lipoprotein [uncultured Bacteroides sp.]